MPGRAGGFAGAMPVPLHAGHGRSIGGRTGFFIRNDLHQTSFSLRKRATLAVSRTRKYLSAYLPSRLRSGPPHPRHSSGALCSGGASIRTTLYLASHVGHWNVASVMSAIIAQAEAHVIHKPAQGAVDVVKA